MLHNILHGFLSPHGVALFAEDVAIFACLLCPLPVFDVLQMGVELFSCCLSIASHKAAPGYHVASPSFPGLLARSFPVISRACWKASSANAGPTIFASSTYTRRRLICASRIARTNKAV